MYDIGDLTIEHKQEVMVTFSETVMVENVVRRYRRYQYHVISGLQENIIISETMHDRREVTIKHK